MNKVVAGVDGGGSNTRVLLLDSTGRVLGAGSAGASNYNFVGAEKAGESLAAAFAEAWSVAGTPQRSVDAAFFGMAGVLSPQGQKIFRDIARAAGLVGTEIEVDHDIRTALAGGLAGDQGIALISGTGSSCYGRSHDGHSWRAGGWGHLLDDVGSGYALAIGAMRSIVRAEDRRGPPTTLTDRILGSFSLSDVQDLMHQLYDVSPSRSELARLAPIVIEEAVGGDREARRIVEDGAVALAEMAAATAGAIFPEKAKVSVTAVGGLINGSEYFFDATATALTRLLPSASLHRPLLSPAAGAAILALARLGYSLNHEQIEELQKKDPFQ